MNDQIFTFQERYAKNFLKKLKTEGCIPVNTPVESGVKSLSY